MSELQLGIVGLGKIGGGLALHALDKGMRVAGYDRAAVSAELTGAGLRVADSLQALTAALARPRIVFLYIPAGAAVDAVTDELLGHLERDDVIVDGGNSYWGDSICRHDRARAAGVGFVDLGTSGGVSGARTGACFMAGGERADVEQVEPILVRLAVEGGYVHAGGPGAGHFTKLVHNGIEFGMLQAIAEGVALLEHHHEPLAVADVLRCWCNGSVIRSWLVELMEAAYRERGGLDGVPPYVEETGEVNWLVSDALRMEVATPVIAQSVWQLIASRERNGVAARAVAAMRHGFGGHPFGADAAIRRERAEGRVGDVYRPRSGRRSARRKP